MVLATAKNITMSTAQAIRRNEGKHGGKTKQVHDIEHENTPRHQVDTDRVAAAGTLLVW